MMPVSQKPRNYKGKAKTPSAHRTKKRLAAQSQYLLNLGKEQAFVKEQLSADVERKEINKRIERLEHLKEHH